MKPIVLDEIALLWLIALSDIQSAHGEASERPVVDTVSPAYYTALVRKFEGMSDYGVIYRVS